MKKEEEASLRFDRKLPKTWLVLTGSCPWLATAQSSACCGSPDIQSGGTRLSVPTILVVGLACRLFVGPNETRSEKMNEYVCQ